MTKLNMQSVYTAAAKIPRRRPKIDIRLWNRWAKIQKHLVNPNKFTFYETKGMLFVPIVKDLKIILAKHTQQMRLQSRLDWVYYSPKDLAEAVNNGTVFEYYEQQRLAIKLLDHPGSQLQNNWQDPVKEAVLKTHYAERVNRPVHPNELGFAARDLAFPHIQDRGKHAGHRIQYEEGNWGPHAARFVCVECNGVHVKWCKKR